MDVLRSWCDCDCWGSCSEQSEYDYDCDLNLFCFSVHYGFPSWHHRNQVLFPCPFRAVSEGSEWSDVSHTSSDLLAALLLLPGLLWGETQSCWFPCSPARHAQGCLVQELCRGLQERSNRISNHLYIFSLECIHFSYDLTSPSLFSLV